MTRKILILVTAMLLTAGLTLAAPPSHKGHGGHDGHDFNRGEWRHERMLEKMIEHLDLSRSQAEQIESTLELAREDGRATREQIRALERQIHETLQADDMDETAVRQRFAEKAALEAEAAIQRSQVHRQVLSVLDDDQRAQLKELRAERRPMHPRGPRH